jgi:uncharacterized protein (TIGR03435 family)
MYKNDIRNCLCHAVCAIAFGPMGAGFHASAQTPSTDLSFEVATVKPVLMDASHPFDPKHSGAHVDQARASYWTMKVGSLVAYAYGVDPTQAIGGPEWANHDYFDIEAKLPEGADKKDDRRMLQVLLKDRFKLAFHIEKRELDIYVLGVGKRGEKLKPSPPDPSSPETVDTGKKGAQTAKYNPEQRVMHFEFSKMTMAELARSLRASFWGVPNVVDETGIKGTYQLAYDCPLPTPPSGPGALSSEPEDGSSLTRSLDALGLKLEKRKILMDVYVIDHVDRPSEN